MEHHNNSENSRRLTKMSSLNGFEKWPKYEVIKNTKIQKIDDKKIGVEEPALKRKKLKPAKMKQSSKVRPKQLTKPNEDCCAINESSSNHESPKIWDIFERFQKFSKRKLLTRTKSGLLDSSETVNEEIPNANDTAIMASRKHIIHKDDSTNRSVTINATAEAVVETLLPKEAEPFVGGDRKRRLAEIVDYDDGHQPDGKRIAQPASSFKPKCLNFDEIDDVDHTKERREFSTSTKLKPKRIYKRK